MTVSSDLDRRFRDAAVTLDLVDVGFNIVDSPIGRLLVAASGEELAAISFRTDPEEQLDRLARIAGPRVLRSARSIAAARRELDEYFEGDRHAFDLSLDYAWPSSVHRLRTKRARSCSLRRDDDLRHPRARSRRPRAARAVGTVMNRNRIPIVLPCHRVVGSSGDLTGYAGGLDVKQALLELEGAR